MTLPIDRTALIAAQTNQVPNQIIQSAKNIAALKTPYDTIDELYAFSAGLVNAGIVTQASQTPIANKIAQRDANGNVLNALPVSNGQNPNLLFNPSFRLGSSGWRGIGTNGFAAIFGSGGDGGYLNIAIGNASAAVVQADNNFNMIPAVASQNCTLSAEIFAVGVTAGSIGVQWFAYDANKVQISGANLAATNGSSWTKYSTSFTTPANTAYIQVACYMGANTTNTNAAWKKIKLESGTVVTTFSDDNTLNTVQYGSALPFSQVISGGFKEQSGQVNVVVAAANTPASVVVTFPIAFATIPIVFPSIGLLGGGESGYTTLQPNSITTTGFNARVTSYLAQTVTFNWIAKGT